MAEKLISRNTLLHTLTLVIATSAALSKLEKIVAIAKVSELNVMAMCVVARKPSARLGAILQGHCPKIQTFCGINLREAASGKIKSKQQVRKLLHKDFVAHGGGLNLGLWSKSYWRGRALVMAESRKRSFNWNFHNMCAMM